MVLGVRLPCWRQENGNKKPGSRPGFIQLTKKRANCYPAGCAVVGRRARDVMPAAMRALVRTNRLALRWTIRSGRFRLSGRPNDYMDVLRIATCPGVGPQLRPFFVISYSPGVALRPSSQREPGPRSCSLLVVPAKAGIQRPCISFDSSSERKLGSSIWLSAGRPPESGALPFF